MFNKAVLMLIGAASAATGAPWNYKKNGSDWPEAAVADNECGGRN